jgi:hypothetical protein
VLLLLLLPLLLLLILLLLLLPMGLLVGCLAWHIALHSCCCGAVTAAGCCCLLQLPASLLSLMDQLEGVTLLQEKNSNSQTMVKLTIISQTSGHIHSASGPTPSGAKATAPAQYHTPSRSKHTESTAAWPTSCSICTVFLAANPFLRQQLQPAYYP